MVNVHTEFHKCSSMGDWNGAYTAFKAMSYPDKKTCDPDHLTSLANALVQESNFTGAKVVREVRSAILKEEDEKKHTSGFVHHIPEGGVVLQPPRGIVPVLQLKLGELIQDSGDDDEINVVQRFALQGNMYRCVDLRISLVDTGDKDEKA